jgi:hypothetical protein
MVGRDYFARQAAVLLRLARLTKDAGRAGELAAKAADLTEKRDTAQDVSPMAPDVEAQEPASRRGRT